MSITCQLNLQSVVSGIYPLPTTSTAMIFVQAGITLCLHVAITTSLVSLFLSLVPAVYFEQSSQSESFHFSSNYSSAKGQGNH